MKEVDPAPVTRAALARALDWLASDHPYKACLEELLLELDAKRADASMLLHKESRAAWLPLVCAESGAALLVGNTLSGSVPPMASFGWRVTVVVSVPNQPPATTLSRLGSKPVMGPD